MEAAVLDYLARFSHVLFGITWIGLLYYFNFVQTEYFKEAEPSARVDAFSKLAPRALWWFRWAAMLTFITGLVLLYPRHTGLTADITVGATMATLMFLNVWLIIWPNQKIIVESNQAVAAGGEANPDAAAAAPKAALASRTNTLFSIPMLYFMGSSAHLPSGSMSGNMTAVLIALAIVAALEANAIYGKQGPLTTVRGVIISGFVLTAVLVAILWLI
ncbi:MAG TPA: antitermination protein NusG [Gammaproteobacteria bacterium]|nr:MAG: antitermination protein NusG [OM182 bacterium]HAL41185.1 antitermination protein NusG [Gammaproteobacteria bacterium]|tara:strand:- start:12614 stop:13264 length:651 start_codon:yes stop_codon:yes gene_type:complete